MRLEYLLRSCKSNLRGIVISLIVPCNRVSYVDPIPLAFDDFLVILEAWSRLPRTVHGCLGEGKSRYLYTWPRPKLVPMTRSNLAPKVPLGHSCSEITKINLYGCMSCINLYVRFAIVFSISIPLLLCQ